MISRALNWPWFSLFLQSSLCTLPWLLFTFHFLTCNHPPSSLTPIYLSFSYLTILTLPFLITLPYSYLFPTLFSFLPTIFFFIHHVFCYLIIPLIPFLTNYILPAFPCLSFPASCLVLPITIPLAFPSLSPISFPYRSYPIPFFPSLSFPSSCIILPITTSLALPCLSHIPSSSFTYHFPGSNKGMQRYTHTRT